MSAALRRLEMGLESFRIQEEILAAKHVHAEHGCTWTEALKAAKQLVDGAEKQKWLASK